jgi:regulatory protein
MQTPKRLLHLAVAALARREYSRAELARLLSRKCKADESADDIDAVVDRLCTQGLLDDARVAQSFAQARTARHGSIRIGHELARMGIARETIRSVLPDAQSEMAAARSLWQRRFGAPAANARERSRQMRFLAARGFHTEIIARVLGAIEE